MKSSKLMLIAAALTVIVITVTVIIVSGQEKQTDRRSASADSSAAEQTAVSVQQAVTEPPVESNEVITTEITPEEEPALKMEIAGTPVTVAWEENASVEALKELCRDGALTVQMSMYGGFEQVGSLGTSLPRDDIQTAASSGDIVLYSGDQIVVFYGSNSWSYTRLGHITDSGGRSMEELLGNGNISLTVSLG